MLKMESCKGGPELTQGDKYETKEASSLRPTPSTKKDSKETLYDQKASRVPEIGQTISKPKETLKSPRLTIILKEQEQYWKTYL